MQMMNKDVETVREALWTLAAVSPMGDEDLLTEVRAIRDEALNVLSSLDQHQKVLEAKVSHLNDLYDAALETTHTFGVECQKCGRLIHEHDGIRFSGPVTVNLDCAECGWLTPWLVSTEGPVRIGGTYA